MLRLITGCCRKAAPPIAVTVTAALDEPTDFSILGDWSGKQVQPGWSLPYGLIPLIEGLPAELSHEQKKALSAAAANYGCPLLYLAGEAEIPEPAFEGRLTFDEDALAARYEALRPRQAVSLIVIGCPQASVGELRAVAARLRGRRVRRDPAGPGEPPPLWVFTSSANRAIAEKSGITAVIRESGALLLENTCPEVVPYDPSWVRHVLTNSMKAEHYIGPQGIRTSVAAGPLRGRGDGRRTHRANRRRSGPGRGHRRRLRRRGGPLHRLPAHSKRPVTGCPLRATFASRGGLCNNTPVTFLGFVNRETGVVEEPGHPADGESMAGRSPSSQRLRLHRRRMSCWSFSTGTGRRWRSSTRTSTSRARRPARWRTYPMPTPWMGT